MQFELLSNPLVLWPLTKCTPFQVPNIIMPVVHAGQPRNRNCLDYWLVVSTPLQNISQWEGLSHILWKIKNVPNHQPSSVVCGDLAFLLLPPPSSHYLNIHTDLSKQNSKFHGCSSVFLLLILFS